jgi:hypothetical protein
MTSESQIQKARQNVSLMWGREGIDQYIDLGFDFDYLADTGKTEKDLWSASKGEIEEACRSVQKAVEILDSVLVKYEHLYQAKNFYFESLEEYWLMNVTYDFSFESSLESIVEDSYDGFRMHGATFEDAEASADLCEQELARFLSENDTEALIELMMSTMAGLPS